MTMFCFLVSWSETAVIKETNALSLFTFYHVLKCFVQERWIDKLLYYRAKLRLHGPFLHLTLWDTELRYWFKINKYNVVREGSLTYLIELNNFTDKNGLLVYLLNNFNK